MNSAGQSVKATSPFEQVTHRIDSELAQLSSKLSELYERLKPYLADIPLNNAEAKGNAQLGISPVVVQLVGICDRIALLTDELNSIK